MLRKFHFSLLVVILLITTASIGHAYPAYDFALSVQYHSQTGWTGSILGCQENDTACQTSKSRQGHTLGKYGCAVTSMAMLYNTYGFWKIPDDTHYPSMRSLNPASLNDYFARPINTPFPLPSIGGMGTLGFNWDYDIDWKKATTNFWYQGPGYYGLYYMVPKYDCSPYTITEPGGTIVRRDAGCFRVNWQRPSITGLSAMELLDWDLQFVNYNPPIMKIKYTPARETAPHTHFVVIGGYDRSCGSADGCYRAYNPMFGTSQFVTSSVTWWGWAPSALKSEKQYGQMNAITGANLYTFNGMVELYRFTTGYSANPIDTSSVDMAIYSPVEIQVIDPDGNIIGYDPETGEKLTENSMSLYYEDTPITALDGSDAPSEPIKRLEIIQPKQGNYILNVFGTGDGPYTIKMAWTKSDGTFNLMTSLTGTATPSLAETYRIAYSPTGEASLSQTNQAPIANAGVNQTGEQSYEITLDGSASHDPDGDPLKYTWSFTSKPDGSMASFSDATAAKPTFIPDRAGTYVLQLVANDYFTDSAPSTVTITATPVVSRVSVTPNFSSPLNEGPGFISFDVNNIGRVVVSSGIINLTLTDPDGNIVSTGNQAFSMATGEAKTVSVPVTIPPLKFGNYTLTYTQSDETKTGSFTTISIPNSVAATFSFDKTSYRVRETANLTLNLSNTGKFNLNNLSLTVSVPDAGFTDTKTFPRINSTATTYAISIPETIAEGQHDVSAILTLPSASNWVQTSNITIPSSALTIRCINDPTLITAGDTINFTIENAGGKDTAYATEKFAVVDSMGIEIYSLNLSGTALAGETKILSSIQIPDQIVSGLLGVNIKIRNNKTGSVSLFDRNIQVVGLADVSLQAKTDKATYLKAESITGISTISNDRTRINGGALKVAVNRTHIRGERFSHYLPNTGWWPFRQPRGINVGSDGSIYVADTGNNRVQKFDTDGKFIESWGSFISSGGQFSQPYGVAVAPDGSIYVTDTWNNRIQKADHEGNFITVWGSYGIADGQFRNPTGIAVGVDGSVYVADTYNHRIQRFDGNGNFILKWSAQFNSPYGIAVGSDNSIYVADSNNNQIQKFDANGNFITKWGSAGSGYGQFRYPCSIAIGPDGSVYVADTGNSRIEEFDDKGNFILSMSSSLSFPQGIFVDSDGSIVVSDSGNNNIQKLDKAGTVVAKWGNSGNGAGEFKSPGDAAVAPDGSLYILDTGNNRIQHFDDKGLFINQWGSYGTGNGQFNDPQGIAVAPGGGVYVADTGNHRIQKFNSDGSFVFKMGNYGINNAQFNSPSGIAVGSDGYVYVADSNNRRVQKFDSNGNFVIKWGGFTSFNSDYPSRIAVGPDNVVYVIDGGYNSINYNYYIRKFDSNGTMVAVITTINSYLTGIAVASDNTIYIVNASSDVISKIDSDGNLIGKWGGHGSGDGQFSYPHGVAVSSDGSVFVPDTSNGRIQKKESFMVASETIFESTTPITQFPDTNQNYITNIDALNGTGKLYLEAELKNSLGQVIAKAEYPFYIIEGNTALLFSTDKKVYKPGETVTVTGEVRNLASIEAVNLKTEIKSQKSDGTAQTIFTETFSVSAGGSYPFTATTTADGEGSVTLAGTISQNNSTLAEIADQYEVASPKMTAMVTGPDVAGNEPFTINVELKNNGKSLGMANLQTSTDGQTQAITIGAGETRLLQYNSTITNTTTYTFTLTGDLNQTITKTVAYGPGARIQFGVQSSGAGVFTEGKTTIPVTITNTGLLDETLSVSYKLSGVSTQNDARSYFIPKGGSVTDSLYYDLTAGSYQLAASASQPAASAQAAFSVVKENVVAMTSTAGTAGTDGLIPVAVNLTNSGYNDINGTITLAVMNNDGKAVWRGEAQVSNLKSQSSGNYTINVDSAGIISGAYKTDVLLYSSSGLQLASNQTQVRVLGPIFEVTSVPANPAFTVGKQALLNFAVKNTGTAAGTATFSAKAMDILDQSSAISLGAGEEKALAFNFMVPEDAEEKDYPADYTLTPAMSQATKGQAGFRVNEVKVNVAASLDKEAYRNGETAVLTLNVSKLSQTEDGQYIAIIRYGSCHDMQPFTLSAQPAALTFNVPLTTITGERLFYGIHFESGNAIYRNSIALNEALADLAADFKGQMTDDRVLTPQVGRDNTVEIATAVTNYGKTASAATSLSLYDGDTLLETKPVRALNPGESTEMSAVLNVLGKAGNRTIRALVDPEDIVPEYSEMNNTGTVTLFVPDATIFTDTDKETYKIRQKAFVTSTITNLTSEKTFTNLLLLTSAKDSSGSEVYTKSLSLGSLAALNSTTSGQVWSTAGLAVDGVYGISQRLFAGSDLMSQSTKTITLEKAPDFTLTTDVATRKAKQGEQAVYTASVAPFNGWNHEVSFSMDGLPSGTSAAFSPDAVVPPDRSTVTVATGDATPAGVHTLYLSGQGTDEGEIVVRTVPLTLDMSAFGIGTSMPERSVKQLVTAAFPITVGSENGYEGTVSLSVTGLPRGTKASLDAATVQAPGTANLSIRTSKYAKPGMYTVTVTGSDGLVSHSVDVSLTLQPNPAIAAGIVATAGPGPQNDAVVKLFSANGQLIREFTAFDSKYGATAVTADIDGDGYDEIIVAQGPGSNNAGTLRAFKRDGTLITEYAAFNAKYGLKLASADLDGDWADELIVGMGPDPKNPGALKIIKYTGAGFTDVMTYSVDSRNSYGLNVAAGDVDGDGVPEIITAPGPRPDNPETVSVWKYAASGLTLLNTFPAFEGNYGVNIAAGDTDADGKAEIVTGTGPDPKNTSVIRIYRADGTLLREFAAYESGHDYGVSVSAGDLDGDGAAEIITGLGPGPQNETLVKVFKSAGTESGNFLACPEIIKYGVRISAGNTGSN